MTTIIGVDVGGTSTEAVVIDSNGKVLASSQVGTSTPGGDEVLGSIEAAIARLAWRDPVDSLGVGMPGQVDTRAGSVRHAVNLGMDGRPFPLADRLSSAHGMPVLVENDVRAAAFGVFDKLQRAGEEPGDLALLSLGTGVAAGVVIDGAIHRGATGMAGEIGHVVVDRWGPICRCGQTGCLETIVSGPAIASAWKSAGQHTPASSLFAAAAGGDGTAMKLANEVLGHLATAIHWLAAAYDVNTIVLGGGLAGAGEALLDAVRYALIRTAGSSDLATRTLDPNRIRLSPSGGPHGARGAALLAARRFDLALATESNPTGGET
ncbi:MAG TPA: ROK family protein [Acidimicrobiia bacterium]|nr:ROK family protein [Acidimicrobiia bacterium]